MVFPRPGGDAMRRFTLGTILATVMMVVAATGALSAPNNSDELLKDELHRLEQANTQFKGGQKGGEASGIAVVGQHDLGGRGFNADVWFHDGYAYVGQWGFTDWSQGSKQRFCPEGADSGVAVVDARDPSSPQDVARLQNPPGTSIEDLVVFAALYGPLAGRDIAAAG